MVRFLHTADWQLGMKAKLLGESADKAREVRLETARRLIQKALERNVDFVIVAGDIFESNAVERDLIRRLLEIFKEAPGIPIYLLPGNHDPLTPDSIYRSTIWRSTPGNIQVLGERRPYPLGEFNVTLYPSPIQQKVSRLDPTSWITHEAGGGDGIRIGVAHGALSIEGFIENPNFPISPHRAEEAGLDYLALGDWHSLFRYKSRDGVERTVYPGTPEPTAFDEANSGKALFVEIEKPGASPQIEEFECAQLRWLEWEREVAVLDQFADLLKEIRDILHPERTLLRLHLRGATDIDTYSGVGELRKLGEETLMFVEIDATGFYLKPDIGKIKSMIPGTMFRKTMEALEALMTRSPSLSRHVDVDPDLAEERLEAIKNVTTAMDADARTIERAIAKLYQMAREVGE